MFTCQVDLSHFKQAAARTIETVHFGVRDAVRNAAEAAEIKAKEGKFKDQTGNLRRSIIANFVSSNVRGAIWSVIADSKYAQFVEYPTKAHDIYPKAGYNLKGPVRNGQTRRASGRGPHESVVGRGRALRWVSGGVQHFAAHVWHPGTSGTYFMRDALVKAEEVLYRELEYIGDRVSKIWS